MNLPSLDKYENEAVKGATVVVDSTLIERKVVREDINAFYVPATKMAMDMGAPTLANMILLGKVIKESGVVTMDGIEEAMKKVVPPKKADLIEINLKAIRLGYEY